MFSSVIFIALGTLFSAITFSAIAGVAADNPRLSVALLLAWLGSVHGFIISELVARYRSRNS